MELVGEGRRGGQRGSVVHGKLTGVRYLQDLYTSEEARGVGVARALIQEVASRARKAGASRCYWLTEESNAVARVLYEKVAKYNGFIRYDFPLRSDA